MMKKVKTLTVPTTITHVLSKYDYIDVEYVISFNNVILAKMYNMTSYVRLTTTPNRDEVIACGELIDYTNRFYNHLIQVDIIPIYNMTRSDLTKLVNDAIDNYSTNRTPTVVVNDKLDVSCYLNAKIEICDALIVIEEESENIENGTYILIDNIVYGFTYDTSLGNILCTNTIGTLDKEKLKLNTGEVIKPLILVDFNFSDIAKHI